MQLTTSRLSAYCNGGYLTVGGWGIERNLMNVFLLLDRFQRLNGITGPLSEIGVHEGRTFVFFALLQRDNETAIGIDLFEEGQNQNIDKSGHGSHWATRNNLSKHAPAARYQLFAENSFNLGDGAVAAIKGSRLFHIDGGHTFETTLNDLHIAQSALVPGGVICIDDYWNPGFPGVHEAVGRYFTGSSIPKAVPVLTGMNKIFLAHVSHKDQILNFMREHLPPDRNQIVRSFGHASACCQSFVQGEDWIVEPEI